MNARTGPCDFVVAGALAQRPGRAGHAWLFVNWMRGALACGWRPLFVDRIDATLGDVEQGVRWVASIMKSAGFADSWSVDIGDGQRAGLCQRDVLARASDAVLLDVMGYLCDDDVRERVACAVFLDIDPGFGQSWHAGGLADVYGNHDRYATVGLNVGQPECGVPDVGVDWIAVLPPVDLAAWARESAPAGPLTTIGSWRGPFAPVEIEGTVYGLRAHAVRPLADLPRRVRVTMEMALDIEASDYSDRARLIAGGWRLRDPSEIGDDLDAYRLYVHDSTGEFGVAKEIYSALRTGWFSDRSACYLASGRPVIVTDTGLARHLPLGKGVLAYRTPDEAAAAVEMVTADPIGHGEAARAIADEFFDARRVVVGVLEEIA